MEPGADDDLRKIANLEAWKQSGVVMTLKNYSAEDADVCAPCRRRHGLIVRMDEGAIGESLPPLDACVNERCRCYFRPRGVSLQLGDGAGDVALSNHFIEVSISFSGGCVSLLCYVSGLK